MATHNPRPVVICGPSGSGKSTLLSVMLKEFPEKFGFSISHTTRKPRPGEEHGKHYYFTSREDMLQAIENNEFIESAEFSGNLYGTSKRAVEDVQKMGKVCVLDINIDGVKQVKASHLNAWFIFIQPPSLEELRSRLLARNTETEESLNQRLGKVQEELAYGQAPNNFDKIIVNHTVENAYAELREFLINKVFKE